MAINPGDDRDELPLPVDLQAEADRLADGRLRLVDSEHTELRGEAAVLVDGRDFTVKPSTPTTGTFVGVLTDSEGTVKDLDKKLNDSSYTLPALFNWLNASRTILEAGDFWLLLLGGVLILVFKAAAPLMMAVDMNSTSSGRNP